MTEKNGELEKLKRNSETENIFLKIKNMRKCYYKKLLRKKKINTAIEFIVLTTSAISTTNIIISISIMNPITLIISAVFSGISTILKIIQNGLKMKEEQEKLHITYCNLSDLERDILHNIENNKCNHDFIVNINHRLSLIENNAIIISLNSK